MAALSMDDSKPSANAGGGGGAVATAEKSEGAGQGGEGAGDDEVGETENQVNVGAALSHYANDQDTTVR